MSSSIKVYSIQVLVPCHGGLLDKALNHASKSARRFEVTNVAELMYIRSASGECLNLAKHRTVCKSGVKFI